MGQGTSQPPAWAAPIHEDDSAATRVFFEGHMDGLDAPAVFDSGKPVGRPRRTGSMRGRGRVKALTPAQYAIHCNSEAALEELIALGCSLVQVTLVRSNSYTALGYAVAHDRKQMVSMLLRAPGGRAALKIPNIITGPTSKAPAPLLPIEMAALWHLDECSALCKSASELSELVPASHGSGSIAVRVGEDSASKVLGNVSVPEVDSFKGSSLILWIKETFPQFRDCSHLIVMLTASSSGFDELDPEKLYSLEALGGAAAEVTVSCDGAA